MIKDVIKKSAVWGLVGVPVFIVSLAIVSGVAKGINQATNDEESNK